jgi:hypothetical protein
MCACENQEGQMWCQDDVWGVCDECGLSSTKYVRADRVEELETDLTSARREIDRSAHFERVCAGLEAERDRLREALEKIGDHPMKFTMPRDDSYWSRLAVQLATTARATLDGGK